MRIIYLILICFIAPVAAIVSWWRGIVDPSRRERLADRLGMPALQRSGRCIWVHAASMGEVQAGAVLVRRLLKKYPDYDIVMTTMTTTGAARARALFPERVEHCYLPYDLPFAVRRFLDRVQPKLALILETELWPNLLRECRNRGVPVVIASARISSKTAHRYERFASLFRYALGPVTVGAQTLADAERFRNLGAQNVQVTGNIKFDLEIPDIVRVAGAQWRKEFEGRLVWVAGSTHAGEESAALAAHKALLALRSDALLLLVPRHPQRFEEVRRLLGESSLHCKVRSREERITADTQVFLVDTMGELLNCYAAADIAFVGGSLVPVGGHNLLEPAALGVPVLCGPFMSSSADVAALLVSEHAVIQVTSASELTNELRKLASDENRRQALARQGLQTVAANRGALDRTLTLVPRLANEQGKVESISPK